MGIYDRDYYRNDGPGFLAALTERGRVCKWLVALNAIVYVVQHLSQRGVFGDLPLLDTFTAWFDLETGRVLAGEVWRLLTYAFLHDPQSLLHLLFNMLLLWVFGTEIEEMYGKREFLGYYLATALLGGIGYVVAQLTRLAPSGTCVGASGAVTALMVLYALHFPRQKINLFFVLPLPIWVVVFGSVAIDLFHLVGGIHTRTAVTVHLAGALFGWLYWRHHWRLSGLLPNFQEWRRRRSRPRLRVYREEAPRPESVAVAAPPSSAPPPAPVAAVDEQLEAELDAVLEKMARHGQASLTEGERQILFRASEVYRRRRR